MAGHRPEPRHVVVGCSPRQRLAVPARHAVSVVLEALFCSGRGARPSIVPALVPDASGLRA